MRKSATIALIFAFLASVSITRGEEIDLDNQRLTNFEIELLTQESAPELDFIAPNLLIEYIASQDSVIIYDNLLPIWRQLEIIDSRAASETLESIKLSSQIELNQFDLQEITERLQIDKLANYKQIDAELQLKIKNLLQAKTVAVIENQLPINILPANHQLSTEITLKTVSISELTKTKLGTDLNFRTIQATILLSDELDVCNITSKVIPDQTLLNDDIVLNRKQMTGIPYVDADISDIEQKIKETNKLTSELTRLQELADTTQLIQDDTFLKTVLEVSEEGSWPDAKVARLTVLPLDAEIKIYAKGTCFALDVGKDGEFGRNWADILRWNSPPRVIVNWRSCTNVGHVHGQQEMARKAAIIKAMIGLVRENSPQTSTWALIANGVADYVELQAEIAKLQVDGIAIWNLTNFAALHDAKLLKQRFDREYNGKPVWIVGFYGQRPQSITTDINFNNRLADSQKYLHQLGYAGLNLIWTRPANPLQTAVETENEKAK